MPTAGPQMHERDTAHRAAEAGRTAVAARGLIVLALLALLIELARAGHLRAFPPGWWRL